MHTQQAAIKIAREFADAILAKGFPLKKAILFGSYARNEQHEWSDIDMALVADEFFGVSSFDLRHFAEIKVNRKYIDIEPHTFRTDYFQKGDPFIDEINRTGIELPLKKPAAQRPGWYLRQLKIPLSNMDRIKKYRNHIKKILEQYAGVKPANMPDVDNQLIFDEKRNHYQLFSVGWDGDERVHGCIFHVDIIGGKIWIQEDNSDRPIAQDLLDSGIPKSDIVLAFYEPEVRKMGEFAVA